MGKVERSSDGWPTWSSGGWSSLWLSRGVSPKLGAGIQQWEGQWTGEKVGDTETAGEVLWCVTYLDVWQPAQPLASCHAGVSAWVGGCDMMMWRGQELGMGAPRDWGRCAGGRPTWTSGGWCVSGTAKSLDSNKIT